MDINKIWQKKGLLSACLMPLSGLYLGIHKLRRFLGNETKINSRVICVGNVVLGGGGKTPLSIELFKCLSEQGQEGVFLSRGYKGTATGPVMFNNAMSAAESGDEVRLLAKVGDVCISKDRKKGADFLANKYDFVIMDDGYQSKSVYKDINILVVYGEYGFGNGLIFPAGPLRELPKSAIERCDIFIVLERDRFNIIGEYSKELENKLVARGQYICSNLDEIDLSTPAVAFCALAFNEKFFKSLEDCGVSIAKTFGFGDHYKYSDEEVDEIIALAQKNQWQVITTSKDYVKLSARAQKMVKEFKIHLSIDKMSDIASFITTKAIGYK